MAQSPVLRFYDILGIIFYALGIVSLGEREFIDEIPRMASASISSLMVCR